MKRWRKLIHGNMRSYAHNTESTMDAQESHEFLLKLLRQHPDFNGANGGHQFKLRREPLAAPEVKDFDDNETGAAAILVLSALNIRSGSVVGSHDVYQLFHHYFSDPSCRKVVDSAVRDWSAKQFASEMRSLK